MKVQPKVKENTVTWTWSKPLKYIHGKKLTVEYPHPIENIPNHLLNFTFLLAFQDILVWNGGIIEVDELTENEYNGINGILHRNHKSQGCAGQDRHHRTPSQPTQIKPHSFEGDTLDLKDGVVVCNGYGKDGMNCALLAKELGYDPLLFTMLNQYKTDRLLADRIRTATEFEKKNGLKSAHAWTNYWKIINKRTINLQTQKTGFYPYAFALIMAATIGANTVLDGIQIHNNKTNQKTGVFYCPGETILQFHDITKATGITLSSPLRPLSNYGSQKLLAQRWPGNLEYQRSCMRGIPWCNDCAKCNRKALYLTDLGIPPQKVGLETYNESKLGLEQYGPVNESVIQLLSKQKGEPYDDWPWKANKHVFPLIWEGRNLRRIYQEHFETYSKDSGPDGQGWTLEPSKWRSWLK